MNSTYYAHYDDTGTRVNGKNQYCHIISSPLFVHYATRPRKDRLTVLDVLLGWQKRDYFFDELAFALLEGFKVPQSVVQALESSIPLFQTLSEEEMKFKLDALLPNISSQHRTRILEAGAIAAYHTQTGFPVLKLMICDDAPQFKAITLELALCWIHEGRHYKKLTPILEIHRKLLDEYIGEFWKYYDKLLSWKENPELSQAESLKKEFDELFGKKTGYDQLDERIQKTLQKKENLLKVLVYPEIPLHNNPAELPARARARKRDVSYGPRSQEGVDAWDIFMTIAETAKKLGISFFKYIYGRITGDEQMPKLSEMIAAKSRTMNQGLSTKPT